MQPTGGSDDEDDIGTEWWNPLRGLVEDFADAMAIGRAMNIQTQARQDLQAGSINTRVSQGLEQMAANRIDLHQGRIDRRNRRRDPLDIDTTMMGTPPGGAIAALGGTSGSSNSTHHEDIDSFEGDAWLLRPAAPAEGLMMMRRRSAEEAPSLVENRVPQLQVNPSIFPRVEPRGGRPTVWNGFAYPPGWTLGPYFIGADEPPALSEGTQEEEDIDQLDEPVVILTYAQTGLGAPSVPGPEGEKEL